MSDHGLSLYVAQLAPTVGALAHNRDLILKAYATGRRSGADLVVTPELALVGYPPEDMVLKPAFVDEAKTKLDEIARATADGPGLLVGLPWREDGDLYNAVALLDQGEIVDIIFKNDLPNYGVFDEKRVFKPTKKIKNIEFRGFRLGVMICEDMWEPTCTQRLKEGGANLLIVPTCSPFADGKEQRRLEIARTRVAESGLPLVFCNQVGAQDELVFDGASFVLDARAQLTHLFKRFEEDAHLLDFKKEKGRFVPVDGAIEPSISRLEALYSATVLGLRDYVKKNRFPGVLLGLSGGIDSALSAAIAVDALGADQVHAVMMPSAYTSKESLEDAAACAKALGIRYDSVPIADAVKATELSLAPLFGDREADVTEENIQSRIRGLFLMALSNKFGAMVLTTGNKSEVAVGYATLYGDMCGGYNAIKDLYKLDVFALSRWRNKHIPALSQGPGGTVIPARIIEKPPSAELRPDQRDDDSLPPYDILDPILRGLVDEEASVDDLVARGFVRSDVERVEHLLYIAEYKRRQAAPGVKISEKLFGRDRRYPITNGYRSASTQ